MSASILGPTLGSGLVHAPVEPAGSAGDGAPAACLNCGSDRLGDYCHVCGQHHRDDRLTLRLLWSEIAARFLMFDSGLARTVRDLSMRPGATALAYVHGHRRRYVNPLSYFLIAAALALFFFNQDPGELEQVMKMGSSTFASIFTEAQTERYIGLVLDSVKVSYAYQMLVFVLSIAAIWRLTFRRSGFTFAELLVPALYGISQVTFVALPLSVAEVAGISHVPPAVAVLLSFVVAPVVLGWMAVGFFGGRRWVAFLKGVASYFLAFALFGVIRDGTLIAYVLLTTP